MGAYLVIGSPASREPANLGLWLWSGEPGAPARRVTLPGLRSFEKAEGVSAAVVGVKERVVIGGGDGNRDAGRFARCLLLDPAQLQTAD